MGAWLSVPIDFGIPLEDALRVVVTSVTGVSGVLAALVVPTEDAREAVATFVTGVASVLVA